MSLACSTDYGCDHDWWYRGPDDEAPLATKRWRKCCSCKALIRPGNPARKIERYRYATEFEETRGIACDEVAMSPAYLCETCGDLADSLSELGYCYTLGGQSLQQQIAEQIENSGQPL